MSDTAIFSDFEKQVINVVLLRQGIRLADLNIESETENFFKSHACPIIVIPENYFISNPVKDELKEKADRDVQEDKFKRWIEYIYP